MTESYDQTQFVAEEPLFEQPVKLTAPHVSKPENSEPKKPSKKRVFMLVTMGLFFFLLLLIVIAAAMRRQTSPLDEGEVIEEEQQEKMIDPFRQRIKDLGAELKAADPTKDDLPFPPVDMDIRLD